jgi:hypothetical protein
MVTVPEDTPVPYPSDWARLHSLLVEARRRRNDLDVSFPPVPLILAGAACSTAAEIRERWRELIRWANDRGFGALLAANLPDLPDRDIAKSIAGADGGPWWHEYSHRKPRVRPSSADEAAALTLVCHRWTEIVGEEMARSTKPLRFTGSKRRRLVVSADPQKTPPWGSWSAITTAADSFAKLRRSINAAIAPMEIDHIDFITETWRGDKAV